MFRKILFVATILLSVLSSAEQEPQNQTTEKPAPIDLTAEKPKESTPPNIKSDVNKPADKNQKITTNNQASDYNNHQSRANNESAFLSLVGKAGSITGSVLEATLQFFTFFGTGTLAKDDTVLRKVHDWNFLASRTAPDAGGAEAFTQGVRNVLLVNQLLKLLPIANDYVCGMLTLSLENGWYIDSVLVNRGSIQNHMQFEQQVDDNEDTIYLPKNKTSTNLLMVKQMTGWFVASNIYWLHNPVDFLVTVSDGDSSSTISVQKSACTLYRYGAVKASVINGDDVPLCISNVSPDPNTDRVSAKASSAYGSPALLRITGNACETDTPI